MCVCVCVCVDREGERERESERERDFEKENRSIPNRIFLFLLRKDKAYWPQLIHVKRERPLWP